MGTTSLRSPAHGGNPFFPMKHDPKVDAYIETAAPFAQPILRHFRKVVHAACPEVEESIKWRFPFFSLSGKNLCAISAFKSYCSVVFWHKDARAAIAADGRTSDGSMGHLGRVTSI